MKEWCGNDNASRVCERGFFFSSLDKLFLVVTIARCVAAIDLGHERGMSGGEETGK